MTPDPTPAGPGIRLGTAAGRWVLAATVLGSGMAFLDGTVVNIALPRIADDLDAGLTDLQWTVNAYTLTLAGLLLLGGALGDRLGRRRVFATGVAWFTAASVLCALSPTVEFLIGARALQGVGAALLTPGSLAIIEAVFHRDDRGAAIGAWSGLGGAAAAIGPFVGGYLIDAVSWRLIFLINVPLAAAVLWASARHVPETRDPGASGRLDVPGALLGAVGLAGVVFALTEGPAGGWSAPGTLAALAAGGAALAAFLAVQALGRNPLVPLGLFAERQFTAANAVTVAVYAALGGMLFLLPIQLQQVLGYTALQAGMALLPMTGVMLLLSARAGRVAQRIGPRLPMSVGPLVVAAGMVMLVRVEAGAGYVAGVLPAVLVASLGLAATVAPLTATVMGAASERLAGTASAVNNDLARIAGLLAVAVIPPLSGISGTADAAEFGDGFRIGVLITAGLCGVGGVLAALTIRNPPRAERRAAPHCAHCAVDAPPLRDLEASAPPAA